MRKALLLVFLIALTGCQSTPTPPLLVRSAPTAKPQPTSKPTPAPKPTPTMTPRQERAQRRAQRRKERAERRRIAREKEAEKRQVALEKQEETDRIAAEQQRAKDIADQMPSNPNSVLAQLDKKYQEDIPEIIRMSANGSKVLAGYGITQSPAEIMYQMNFVMDKKLLDAMGSNNQKYSEHLAMLGLTQSDE